LLYFTKFAQINIIRGFDADKQMEPGANQSAGSAQANRQALQSTNPSFFSTKANKRSKWA